MIRIPTDRYVAIVSNAQKAAAEAALSFCGLYRDLFGVPLVYEDDADDRDPPRAWGASCRFTVEQREMAHDAIKNIPQLKWAKVNARKPRKDEDALQSLAAKHALRMRNSFVWSIGTAIADGSVNAQAINDTPVLLNQWTDLIKLVNMDRDGQRFISGYNAPYELFVRLRFERVQDVTFHVMAARNSELVGGTLSSSSGTMEGKVTGNLLVDDLIGVGVWATGVGVFQLLNGSIIRLRRIAKV